MAPPRFGAAALLVLSACGEGGPGLGDGDANKAGAAPDIAMRAGLWEVRSEILSASQEGLPAELAERARGRRQAVRHCITPEHAARPDPALLVLGGRGSCTHEGFAMRAGRVADLMTCRAPDGALTRARVGGRYEAEAYALRLEIDTPGIGEGRTMRLVTRQTGRRLGDCPAPSQGGNVQ